MTKKAIDVAKVGDELLLNTEWVFVEAIHPHENPKSVYLQYANNTFGRRIILCDGEFNLLFKKRYEKETNPPITVHEIFFIHGNLGFYNCRDDKFDTNMNCASRFYSYEEAEDAAKLAASSHLYQTFEIKKYYWASVGE